MTVALSLLLTALLLAVLAAWIIRRSNPAAAVDPLPAIARRPLPQDCEVGRQLQMASAEGSAGSGTARGAGGAGGGGGDNPSKRKKPSPPSRRTFLRWSMGVGWLGVLGGFGAASLAYLWPDLRGGFGAELDAGDVEEILSSIESEQAPYEFSAGRTYLVKYDPEQDTEGEYTEITNDGQAPVLALFWTCVHLGCKVPWCDSSQWLECGCHGSKYNRWGEYQDGPAPRGLDRFNVRVADGRVMVDTSEIVTGPPRAVDVLQQEPEGPNCT